MSDIAIAARQAYQQAPRWMQMLLLASLGINFIIIGLAAGAVWAFRGPSPLAGVTPNLLGYASTLPAERRKALWDATEAERQHLRPFRREVRTVREETLKALIEEPFDKQKFLKAQARQAETEYRARTAVQELYGKIAAGMMPEERRAFPKWREQRRPPGANLLDETDASKAALPANTK